MSKEISFMLAAAVLIAAFAFSTANAGQSNAGSSSSASVSGGSFASASVSNCSGCGSGPKGAYKSLTGSGPECAVKKHSLSKYKWVISSSSECGCAWRMTGGAKKLMCPVRISAKKKK